MQKWSKVVDGQSVLYVLRTSLGVASVSALPVQSLLGKLVKTVESGYLSYTGAVPLRQPVFGSLALMCDYVGLGLGLRVLICDGKMSRHLWFSRVDLKQTPNDKQAKYGVYSLR